MLLKETRENKGYTQDKLANIIGVTQQAIQKIEKGKMMPSIPTAKKLGKALGIEWTRFFEEEQKGA